MVRLLTALILLGGVLTHPSRVIAFAPTNDTPHFCSARNLPYLAMSTQQQQDQTATLEQETNPRQEGLALLLDDGTRKSHSLAESTAFVTGFFKGVSTRETYRNLLTSLYYVYHAMETSMEETSDKHVKTLDDDVLRRLPNLERDLKFFYGSEWKDSIQPTPATTAYVARIQEVAKTKSYLLIGHQYSRYLGDLFGGVMMGNMARRSLGLQNGDGVAFYQFDGIDDTKDYITEWYTKLNNLDLTDTQKKEIVDEANLVFALNIDIFQELEGGSSFQALWTMGVNTLKLKLGMSLGF